MHFSDRLCLPTTTPEGNGVSVFLRCTTELFKQPHHRGTECQYFCNVLIIYLQPHQGGTRGQYFCDVLVIYLQPHQVGTRCQYFCDVLVIYLQPHQVGTRCQYFCDVLQSSTYNHIRGNKVYLCDVLQSATYNHTRGEQAVSICVMYYSQLPTTTPGGNRVSVFL